MVGLDQAAFAAEMANVDASTADLDPASLAAVTAALQAAVGMNPDQVGDLVKSLLVFNTFQVWDLR